MFRWESISARGMLLMTSIALIITTAGLPTVLTAMYTIAAIPGMVSITVIIIIFIHIIMFTIPITTGNSTDPGCPGGIGNKPVTGHMDTMAGIGSTGNTAGTGTPENTGKKSIIQKNGSTMDTM